jgi:DNA-directed RNA polymerase specialized sigma24 family protein
MEHVPESDLLSAYVECADRSAFAALVERHAGLVYAAAVRQAGNAEEAEDVAQAHLFHPRPLPDGC